MGRTWQTSGRICSPCSKNLSSGHIAKCDPKFQVGKTLKIAKNLKDAVLLGCGNLSAKRDQFETRSICNNRRNFLTFALSLWTDEATTTFRHFNVFAKTLYGRAIHKLVILRSFNVFKGTLHRRPNYSLPRQVPSQVCYFRAKCSLCSQALYFLYFSHPPETGKGGKRSYAKWSDYEEIMFSGIWPTLVLNVSKQRQLTPTSKY